MSPRPTEDKGEKASGRQQAAVSPWEENYELLLCEGLFSEYLEMGQCCWTWTSERLLLVLMR